MFSVQIPRRSDLADRRKAPRSANDSEFRPRGRVERDFGIGYGRSSGYVHNRSYISVQPALFRCR